MKRVARVVVVLVMTLALLALGGAMGQERVKAQEQQAASQKAKPPAAEEVVAAYVSAVKESELYAMARRLDPAEVESATAKWAKEWGVEVKVLQSTFLQLAAAGTPTLNAKIDRAPETGAPVSVRIELPRMRYPPSVGRSRSRPVGNWPGADTVGVTWWFEERGSRRQESASVSVALLKELDFPALAVVTAVDPANATMGSFSVGDGSLEYVVSHLCEKAKLGYALRSPEAGRTSIHVRAENTTPALALRAVAYAAGMNMTFTGASRGSPTDAVYNLATDVYGGAESAEDLTLDSLKARMGDIVKDMLASRPVVALGPRDTPMETVLKKLDEIHQKIPRG